MKENYTHKSKFFYGNKISEYGLQHGYVDYKTLAQAGEMVLCNDITKLFYIEIGREFIEPEQVGGMVDNSEEIEELQNEIDELLEEYKETEDPDRERTIMNTIDLYQEKINSLEYEQENNPEIFQYYIISDNLARILQELTNEIVYYIPFLDVYVWGVTHWGTSWDYVLTNIKIDLEGAEND